MQKFTTVLLIVVGLVFSTGGGASANLINNGDFQTETLVGWDAVNVSIGDLGGSYAALLDASSSDGSNSLGFAELGQSFYIAPGTSSLQVSFDYLFTGIDTAVPPDNDDTAIASLSYRIGAGEESPSDWTFETLFSETSSGSSFGTTISFVGTIDLSSALTDVPSNGYLHFSLEETQQNKNFDQTNTQLYLDNVKVAAVPLPSALLLFGSGLAGLALFPRKIVGRYTQRTKAAKV